MRGYRGESKRRTWHYHVVCKDGSEHTGTVNAHGRAEAKARVRDDVGGETPALIYEWTLERE